jgi:uncharacterized membrane protein (DUF4010 family)
MELRAAILLAILAFVVYPRLPTTAIDPWGLVQPRAAWVAVILIAAIGFGNYVLLKAFGTKGVQITGFLGGLVNSTVPVTELAVRERESDGSLQDEAYRGVLLATCAMAVRNAVLLGIVATAALCSPPSTRRRRRSPGSRPCWPPSPPRWSTRCSSRGWPRIEG